MTVKEMAPGALSPYENNPRKNETAVDAVAASIHEFGFLQPIVVDADGVIIAGHTRKKAAERLGLKTVPVLIADDLTEEQARAYRLADNKTAELSEWDFDLLVDEMGAIESINLESFGFEKPTEIDASEPEEQTELITLDFSFPVEEYESVDATLRAQGTPEAYKTNGSKKGNQLYKVFKKWQAQKTLL